jgi:predicted nucleic acid-binding protein
MHNLLSWVHPGFSVFAGPPVASTEVESIESQARYITRPALAMDALHELEDGNLALTTPPDPRTGTTVLTFDPLEWIHRITAHIPNPGSHCQRYYGEYSNRARATVSTASGVNAGAAADAQPEQDNCGFSQEARSSWALLPVPQFQVTQDLVDHRPVADQADDFERARAERANQEVRFVHFLNQPGPRAPDLAPELVGAAALFVVRRQRNRRGIRNASAGPSPAHIGEGAVVPDQLLSGIRDMAAQSGQEVEGREDAGRRGLGITAALALAAIVDDLAGYLDRKGRTLPLPDVIIGCCARQIGAVVLTTDAHFRFIPGVEVIARPD